MQTAVSYYQADTVPADVAHVDDSLVAVGLAQFPQIPSIMDTINQPVPAYGKAPAPNVIKGSLPDPNFTPNPAIAAYGPSPSIPSSGTMSPISGSKNFASPTTAPGPSRTPPLSAPNPATPASTMTPVMSPAPAPIVPSSPAPGPAPSPYGFSSGSPFPSSPAPGPAPSPYGFSSGSPFPSS